MQSTSTIACGILGSGTCRVSAQRATPSGYLRIDDKLLLIDCGVSVLSRLAESGMLEGCSELDVHISHSHGDHLVGVFALLQGLTWSDDQKDLAITRVRFHCTEEVETLLMNTIERMGVSQMNLNPNGQMPHRSVEFCVGPDYKDWTYEFAGIAIRSVHLPDANNHGLRFSLQGKEIAFTCDATEVGTELREFLAGVDVAVFDFGHMSNRLTEDAQWVFDATPVEYLLQEVGAGRFIATHAYLRDLQAQALTEAQRDEIIAQRLEAISDTLRQLSFRGSLECGRDLMRIL